MEALKQEEEEKERSRVEVTTVQSPTTDGGRSSEVRVFGKWRPYPREARGLNERTQDRPRLRTCSTPPR